MNIKLCI